MTRPEAMYRALLRCYPAAFRNEYGDQMFLMFAEQLRDARHSPTQRAALWIAAAFDALTVAPREHGHVILQDLRYAFRTMAASPSFTSIAILSLALGIGANTAIFGLWNGVLHASLPAVYKPEQLVMLTDPDQQGMWSGRMTFASDSYRPWLTYSEFEQLRDGSPVFFALMASQSNLENWKVRYGDGEWEQAAERLVSNEYFQVLGVSPVLGRTFASADDRGDSPYAVISNSYWRRRFGGREDVIGQTITMPKIVLTVIGVAPPGFIGETSGQQPDVWIPLSMQPRLFRGEDWLHDKSPEKKMWLNVFGRLKPGVTQAQAEAQVNSQFQAGLESFYGSVLTDTNRNEYLDQRIRIQPAGRGASSVRNTFSSSLTTLLAAVGVLLLIACANLANLLLARGAARRPEMALRQSLGASQGRLIRQLMTESLALAAMGGLAGLAVAAFLHGALVQLMDGYDSAFRMSFSLDPVVLAFAFAATLAAALLFGVLPAWLVTGANAGESLKEQGRGSTGPRSRLRWDRFLVSLQLALSVPLLVGAGLLARTVFNLQRVNLGYPAGHLALVRIDTREGSYGGHRLDNLIRELLSQFQQIPSVKAVSFSRLGLFSGGISALDVSVDGYVAENENDRGSHMDVVGPGYFSTLGIPLLIGREIVESDQRDAPGVCVINEAFVKKFIKGRNPIGARITSVEDNNHMTCQVVGVAGNARTQDLRRAVVPRFYVPASSQPSFAAESPTFLVRTAGTPGSVMAAIEQTIKRADPALPIIMARSLEEQMAPLTAQDRAIAQIAVAFGAVALTLAAIGLYGVLASGIARRRGEIAIRIALGARPGSVISMILRETAGLVVAGLVVGVGLAFAASRWITSQLYGVAPQDPATLASGAVVLVVVALCATFLPAHRAARLNPMAALRRE